MKRHGSLWEPLTSFANLLSAWRKARRGKSANRSVQDFDFQRERELCRLRRELLNGEYVPGEYRTFVIHDRKPRLISAAPFRDRIVHHALCNVIEPIFERSFIFDSYACRAGKGTHAAVSRYAEFARRNRYVLKCDIRKFFPSIDHAVLKSLLSRKLKDDRVLWLAGTLIDHSNSQEPVPGYFPGDDLFTLHDRRRGLPIGNQTSQFFANVYLDPLDHFVKESLHCRHYVRYVDDFVILDDDKRRLAEVRDAIEQFLLGLRLWLHPCKRVISRVEDGIRFLGYRIWPHRRRLDQYSVRRLRQRVRGFQRAFAKRRMPLVAIRQSLRAWLGHARHAHTRGLRNRILGRTVFVRAHAEKPRAPRGLLEQQPQEHPLRQPEQEHARQP